MLAIMKNIKGSLKSCFHAGLKTTLTYGVLLGLAGCAAGPDFKRPDTPNSKSYASYAMPAKTTSAPGVGGASQQFDVKRDIPYDWWTLFQSEQLNALIVSAFKANPDIESARAALKQAQEYVTAQQGFFYPTIGANYSPSRIKVAGNNGGSSPGRQGNGELIQTYSTPNGQPPYNAPVYYNFHTAQLSVGFVPDVFGANRRQLESLQAQADMQRFRLEAAFITLASNIVAAALQEASLRSQIMAMDKLMTANRLSLDIMRKRLQLGDVSALDVATQEAALAQSEQALIPLRLQLERTRDLIRALAGNAPDKDVPETFELSALHLPEDLPLSLPSKLVEQRPDVRAAEEQVHAASAEYGVSIANLLPQFSITGDVGGMASTPGWMFKTGGGFFDLTTNIAYTLFDGGQLRAQSRAAQDALEQAAAEYRSTVIAALQNVADTLHAIQSDAEALKAATRNEQAMSRVLDLTRKQYKTGYVSYQTQLNAEQNYQQSVLVLIQAQTNRFGDTAALYQALGGGWWNRPDKSVALEAATANVAKGDSVR
jgi:NodT family efflux transporter outer membrane factor (OMF) lipoprotein